MGFNRAGKEGAGIQRANVYTYMSRMERERETPLPLVCVRGRSPPVDSPFPPVSSMQELPPSRFPSTFSGSQQADYVPGHSLSPVFHAFPLYT